MNFQFFDKETVGIVEAFQAATAEKLFEYCLNVLEKLALYMHA